MITVISALFISSFGSYSSATPTVPMAASLVPITGQPMSTLLERPCGLAISSFIRDRIKGLLKALSASPAVSLVLVPSLQNMDESMGRSLLRRCRLLRLLVKYLPLTIVATRYG